MTDSSTSTDSDDSSLSFPESLARDLNNGVIVHFGGYHAEFSRNLLLKLGFFRARFASRWSNDDSKSKDQGHVYITKASESVYAKPNANESKESLDQNHDSKCDSTNEFVDLGFGFLEFAQLIDYTKWGDISRISLSNDCASIEKFLLCYDYFTCKEDEFQIDEKILLQYLKTTVPRINFKQRQQLKKEAKHPILLAVLKKWNDELQGMMSDYRKDVLSQHVKMNGKLIIDKQTAKDIFVSKFKPRIVVNMLRKQLEVSIDNFTNKDFYIQLWQTAYKDCEIWDEDYTIFSMIPDLVHTIMKYTDYTRMYFKNSDERSVIKTILDDVVTDVMRKEILVFKMGIDLFSLIVATDLKLRYDAGSYFLCPFKAFKRKLKFFTEKNIQEFLQIILSHHVTYSTYYISASDDDDEKKKKRLDGLKSWYKLIQQCICECGGEYIVDIADTWFPVLTKKSRNDDEAKIKMDNIDWIVNVLIPTFGGHASYQFALYLAKNILVDSDENLKITMATKFLQFIQDETGMMYNFKDTDSV